MTGGAGAHARGCSAHQMLAMHLSPNPLHWVGAYASSCQGRHRERECLQMCLSPSLGARAPAGLCTLIDARLGGSPFFLWGFTGLCYVANLCDVLPRAQAADLAAAQAAAGEAGEALAQWQAAYGELQRQYEAAQAAYAELQARAEALRP